jgi:phage-related holin
MKMAKIWEGLSMGAFVAWAFFAPIHTMFIVVMVFIAIDFVTGVWASHARAKRAGTPWAFRSDKAWATIIKFLLAIVGVILAWLLDTTALSFLNLHLAHIFTGIVCGVEFWSFLENGADISPDTPLFRILRKIMAKKVEEKTGIDMDEVTKDENKSK